LWGFVTTINTRLEMVCTFIDTFCKYTTSVMRSLWRSSRCYWSAVGRDGRETVVVVGWRRCCLETAGSVLAVHWGSLGEACCSVKPDEAGELIRLVPTKVFTDLLLSVVTLRVTEGATRTALLVMYVPTGPRHINDRGVIHVRLCPEGKSLMCFSADCQGDPCFGRSFTTVSWRYRWVFFLLFLANLQSTLQWSNK
jgi:hypothetical protein